MPLRGCIPRPLLELLVERGREFTPKGRPKAIRKRKAYACFVNSATHPLLHPRATEESAYLYAEGLATLPGGMMGHHGWIVDHDDNVIDVTWDVPGVHRHGGVPR